MRIAVGMIFAVMLVAVLAGCSGGATQPNAPMADTTVSPSPSTDAMGLMSPVDALAAIPDRASSELLLWRDGHDYEPGLSQLVVDREIGARYYPKWEDGQSGSGDLAFAIYSFNVFGYTRISEVLLEWGDEPEDNGNLWIGLSHWGANRWDWYPGPTEGTLNLADTIDYVKQDSGDVFVAVVLLGSVPATLDWLQVSESEPGAIVVTGVTPDPAEGLTGTNVDFDVLYTGINDITTTYAWDFGGGATPNNPTEKSPAVTLGSAGAYDCSVTVDNGWGDAGTFFFPLRVLGPITITGITPDPAEGYSGHRRMFKVDINGNHDDTTTYNWDFGGGATPNNPTLPSPIVTLGDPGTYDCSVIVDNDYGEPDSYFFSLSSFENQQGPWPMVGLNPQGSRGSQNVGAQTNNVKWKFRAEGDGFYFRDPITGPDGTIYGGGGADLHAVNPDGTVKWYGENCLPRSRPALAADGTVYVGSWDDKLVAFNPDGSLKWSFATGGDVWGTPVIGTDGTVYCGSVWPESIFYAVNPDGSLQWSYTCEGQLRSSPAIGADGTIYVGCDDTKLYAFNPDGTVKWTFTTEREVRSSPVIGTDGTIYVGNNYRKLFAINPDGTLKWEYNSLADVSCKPALGADGTIYLVNVGNQLHAVNPDGTQQWFTFIGNSEGHNYCSPVIAADGTILIGGADYSYIFYAYNPDGTERWSYASSWDVIGAPALGSDGTIYIPGRWLTSVTPEGTLNWTYSTGVSFSGNPVVDANGTVYVVSDRGELYAVNPDGTEKWAFHWSYPGSDCAVGPDGTVYVESRTIFDSFFNAINPDGSLKWSISSGDRDWWWGVPFIGSDGTVYVRCHQTQYAFNPDGTEKWAMPGWSLYSISTDGTYYVYYDGSLRAFDQGLNEKWSFTLEDNFSTKAVVGPDGTIYVGGQDMKLYALNSDGSLKWSSEPFVDSLNHLSVGVDGTVYVTSNPWDSYRGAIHAFNPDGTSKGGSWPFQSTTASFTSPAVDANGTVYVGCQDYKIYAINSDGTEKWSYTTGYWVSSSPAIGADRTVYVGSKDGKLYAFGD